MHSDKCSYCGKWVCHKPILGTLHFCLTQEERAQVDMLHWQLHEQQRIINGAWPHNGYIHGPEIFAGPQPKDKSRCEAARPSSNGGGEHSENGRPHYGAGLERASPTIKGTIR